MIETGGVPRPLCVLLQIGALALGTGARQRLGRRQAADQPALRPARSLDQGAPTDEALCLLLTRNSNGSRPPTKSLRSPLASGPAKLKVRPELKERGEDRHDCDEQRALLPSEG
jgi:hypothetical protein